jgi:hypothetical protein
MTHLAAQTWGERSRAKPAGKREAAGTAATETAEDTRGCRPVAPVAERVAATVEEPEEQPTRMAVGTEARLYPAAHPSRRGRALKPGQAASQTPQPNCLAGRERAASQ